MARVTVEDCILRIPNRFDLVMLAAQRARDVCAGSALTIDRDNDKNPVVALREIAEDKLDLDAIQQSIVKNLSVHKEPEEPEDEGGFGTERDRHAGRPHEERGGRRRADARGRRVRGRSRGDGGRAPEAATEEG